MAGPDAPLTVRILTAEHSNEVSAVWQRANEARRDVLGLSKPPPIPAAIGREGWFGVGVFDAERMVSHAIAMPARADDGRSVHNTPGLAHISSVATLPQCWGQGLALHAMRAIRSLAMRRGYARCQLWTHASNTRSQTLYLKDGFELSGRAKNDDFGEPIVHFVRELTAGPLLRREAARVVCLDRADRVLMMHWRDPYDGYRLWEPPGGGLEPGEDPRLAAEREWVEETGLPVPRITADTQVARDQLWASGRIVIDETFYLGRLEAEAPEPVAAAFTEVEQTSYLGYAWLTRDEIATGAHAGDPIEPDLVPVLERLDA